MAVVATAALAVVACGGKKLAARDSAAADSISASQAPAVTALPADSARPAQPAETPAGAAAPASYGMKAGTPTMRPLPPEGGTTTPKARPSRTPTSGHADSVPSGRPIPKPNDVRPSIPNNSGRITP